VPELPEVETIRRGLQTRIVGKRIASLTFDWPKSFQGEKSKVEGATVRGIERRAKTIRIKLHDDYNLLFHLKMTGQLIWRSPNAISNFKFLISKQNPKPKNLNSQKSDQFAGGHPDHDWHAELPNKHTRIVFIFDDGSRLFFNDLRKFGWCRVLTDKEIEAIHEKDYGVEPLEKGFTAEYLQQHAERIPNRNIKQFLMDQSIVAGVGNIYADESLYLARISPLRKVKDVSMKEWGLIQKCVIEVLEKGIKYGGTTDSDYVDAEGKKGGMQNHLNVYHRTDDLCPAECGGKIERIKVGGRGTHYCPKCQK
jgi:formamidopyrimidine-DNA glycosylase